MIGPLLNAAGIVIGGCVGLIRRKPLAAATESYFRVILGAFTVFYGLRLTWISLGGSWAQILKQLGLVIVSMMIGKLIGRAVRLQRMSNRLGQQARERINNATRGDPDRLNQGFRTCAALFCVAPLGILGSIQ